MFVRESHRHTRAFTDIDVTSCNPSERWPFSLDAAAKLLGLAGETAGVTSAQAPQL